MARTYVTELDRRNPDLDFRERKVQTWLVSQMPQSREHVVDGLLELSSRLVGAVHPFLDFCLRGHELLREAVATVNEVRQILEVSAAFGVELEHIGESVVRRDVA